MRNYFLITVFLPLCLFSQVTEDFSDGDFTQDPAWTGDLNNFKISFSTAVPAEQRPALQLYATEAGISTLVVAQPFNGELEWQFWVKLSLNTSSGNYARVFLLTDTADLKAPLNGYFLQIGGVEDSVIFFRQDSTEITRLLCLDSVFTGNSTNALRFKVFRSQEGNWKFYADPVGGHALDFQGEINDVVFPAGDHFGIFCQYSSSNTTKFYFDDFYAGPLIIDSIPPALLKADVINPSEILLIFSEAVDPEIAENISNYEVIPDLGQPYSAIRLLYPDRVQLFFDLEMQNGAAYTLNISSEKDLSGNESGLITQPVWYYLVLPYDLVITEIMADPTPPRELPEYEYLELFNRSSYSLDLGGLSLIISSTIHELPAYTINPGGYLLLCDDDAVEIMMHLCPVTGLASFTLPNSGTTFQLVDTSGKTICFLQYDLSWYKEDSKSDGGWSIEMIDPANPCLNEENWKASVNASGGTPGYENSVVANQNSEIKMTKACCLNERELEIEFSESLDSLFTSDTSRYSADPFLGHPDLAIPVPPDFRSATLFFNEGFSTDQLYQLTVNPGLKNCIGDEISSSFRSSFALPQPVEPFDIIINEVLFNPLGDGVDYIEIYNRSDKAINLSELILASVKDSPPELPDTQAVSIAASCMVILASHYLLLTSDPQTVKDQYFTSDPEAFLEMASFPSYNNDKGYVLLMDQDKTVIDGMTYSEEMHFLMLNSREGVSLERICPDRLGDDQSNWHSAAETSGFGTPGYKNSQYLEIMEDEDALSIQPEVFSPDGDGVNDNLGIVYNFSSPGKLITVLIFNAEGRLAKTLVNNEMPGTHGIYSWDGTLDDRTPAQNGIYIIFMEALGMDGKTSHYKKTGVLARNR
jgi:hypothetical protein